MNERDCYYCIKRGTMYCPNSSECYETQDKPSFRTKELALREIEQLKTCIMTDHHKIHALVDVIDEVREYIKNNIQEGYSEVYEAEMRWDAVSGDELLQILDKTGDINEKKN